MKKYFIEGTEEEVVFGDSIELDLTKKVKHGILHHKEIVTLSDGTLPFLLKTGVIEEREVEEEEEENNDLIDFHDEPCEALADLIEDFEVLEERVDRLEDMHKDYVSLINKMLDTFKEFVLNLPDKEEEKKNAQSKKK